jgi:hypothetical protein
MSNRYRPEEENQEPIEKRPIPWRRYTLIGGSVIALLAIGVGTFLYQRALGKRSNPPPIQKPAAQEAKVNVPKAFGGSVDSNLLLQLLNAAHEHDLSSGQLHLSLRGHKHHPPTFPVEESFDVNLSSSKDCYFALLHHNSDGTFETVIPREGSGPESDEKLKAGVPKELSAHATPPPGQQEFLLIAAQERLDLDRVLKGAPETYKQSLSVVTFPYIAIAK